MAVLTNTNFKMSAGFFRRFEISFLFFKGGIFIKKDGETQQLLDEYQRKQIQHDIKIFMEQYYKQKLGKGVELTKVNICEDMLIIRGERFLTLPELYIARTSSGEESVRAARMQVVLRHVMDNVPYFEERLNAKVIRQVYDVDSKNDFWMHVMVFDRVLA